MQRIFVEIVLLTSLLFFNAAYAVIPINNGTWVYDTLYNNSGDKIGQQPGLFANAINAYNTRATKGHKINTVFSYGGSMEMYCRGSGGSSNNEPCTADNMFVYYDGIKSTTAYYNSASNTSNPVAITPIVDGQIGDGYLSAFNTMDRATANIFADKVAALYCSDNRITGVQFNIEPFDVSNQGQAFFYQRIARDFAGKNNARRDGIDPFNCVNSTHPNGRTFSIFTFSSKVTQRVANILNQFNNGYVIDSLYDLGNKPGGTNNTLAEFNRLVDREIQNMLAKSKELNVIFQFAIPPAASVHEFETKNGRSTGIKQIAYVRAAITLINANNVRANPNYLGTSLWAWNDRMFWGGSEFTPSRPPADVLAYLANTL